MLKTFFRRWWTTRQLYRLIYRLGDINPPLHATITRSERISFGVEEGVFIEWLKWKWEGWNFEDLKKPSVWEKNSILNRIYYNLPWRKGKRENFNDSVTETISECAGLDYIERKGDKLHMGHVGMEIYV